MLSTQKCGKTKRKLACLLQSHRVRGLLRGRGFPSPGWPVGLDPLNTRMVQGSGAPSLDSQPCPRCPVGSSQWSLSPAPENAPGPGIAGHQERQGLAGLFWGDATPLPSPSSLILETGFSTHFCYLEAPGQLPPISLSDFLPLVSRGMIWVYDSTRAAQLRC